ncbi:hypothetical protein [Actinosynnema sp. NPDC020468]|uniref:hypothetical protein n=1 Tax=Actinosynnema sp. NPDC020468 TaxID=3154488 RepID=UPI0033EA48D7
MNEPVLLALIGFAGVLVTAGPSYLSHRKTRRMSAEAIDTAVTAAVAPVAARLDSLAEDVAEIRVSVAVHEDRWLRPLFPAGRGQPDHPETRG